MSGDFILEITFKGGCREVGRSGLLVNGEVLLDYGIKAGDPAEYPLNSMEPKTVLVSHGHLDHCGAVPNLMYQDPEVFMTPADCRICQPARGRHSQTLRDHTFRCIPV